VVTSDQQQRSGVTHLAEFSGPELYVVQVLGFSLPLLCFGVPQGGSCSPGRIHIFSRNRHSDSLRGVV